MVISFAHSCDFSTSLSLRAQQDRLLAGDPAESRNPLDCRRSQPKENWYSCEFLRSSTLQLIGMILWGIGMGAQDSCLKAVLSAVVPSEKRSTAFGIFDTGFGIAWFVGSAIMGLLYDKSIPALVVFSVALQLLALPVLALAKKEQASK